MDNYLQTATFFLICGLYSHGSIQSWNLFNRQSSNSICEHKIGFFFERKSIEMFLLESDKKRKKGASQKVMPLSPFRKTQMLKIFYFRSGTNGCMDSEKITSICVEQSAICSRRYTDINSRYTIHFDLPTSNLWP